ncbi:MAG: hypothetical protein AAGG68_13890 [Bacteroidota bacterium]
MLKLSNLTQILIALFFSFSCQSQKTPEKISVQIPTIGQEATSIWRTINDINFLESQGYRIHLPKDSLIDSLVKKSKHGKFGNDDFPLIYQLLESKIYNPQAYQLVLDKVQAKTDLINGMIQEIEKSKDQWNWNFKSFEAYPIVFTLYGTGGSYDPDSGVVTLFTTPKGEFTKYDAPEYTIIHEIVHMGIEESIVQKYQLSHGLKERLVDIVITLMFGELLPEYKIQNMGDATIDEYLTRKEDLEHLTSIIEDYRDKN